jgi:hypothetical protein
VEEPENAQVPRNLPQLVFLQFCFDEPECSLAKIEPEKNYLALKKEKHLNVCNV